MAIPLKDVTVEQVLTRYGEGPSVTVAVAGKLMGEAHIMLSRDTAARRGGDVVAWRVTVRRDEGGRFVWVAHGPAADANIAAAAAVAVANHKMNVA